MTVLASDNFDRANANPIGAPWTTITGESAMQIAGNVATPSGLAGDCGSRYSGISWPADQYSKAKLSCTGSAGGGSGACLHVRAASGANTYYRLEVDHAASNNVTLSKNVATVFTTVAGFPVTQAWSDGDTWELRVSGMLLSVYLNGSLIASGTDASSPIVSGSPGIGYSSVETAASINDWEGGDLLSGVKGILLEGFGSLKLEDSRLLLTG